MPNEVQIHPVYRAINKPLTVWGAERRLFFLALIMGGATFNFFGSLVSGIVMYWVGTMVSRCRRICSSSAPKHSSRRSCE